MNSFHMISCGKGTCCGLYSRAVRVFLFTLNQMMIELEILRRSYLIVISCFNIFLNELLLVLAHHPGKVILLSKFLGQTIGYHAFILIFFCNLPGSLKLFWENSRFEQPQLLYKKHGHAWTGMRYYKNEARCAGVQDLNFLRPFKSE